MTVEMKTEKVANYYGNGRAVRYAIERDGHAIARGHRMSTGWADWTLMTEATQEYRTFKSKSALMSYAETI